MKIFRKIVRFIYRLTTLGLSKGPNITRYYMYQHLSKYSAPRAQELKALSISHSGNLGKLVGFADSQIMDVSYPAFNILDLPFKDGEFDAVVSDLVLEHVEGNPQQAIDETFRVLKPNGIVLHTTNLIHPIHGYPNDYWRFTPNALKLLVVKHGHIIDVGGWGNPYLWLFVALGLQYVPVPHTRWHPFHWLAMKNDETWPVVTWVLATKSVA
ncbi:MAG: Methyltransferase type 11 [Candidatus Brocadiaceae bacterium]|nr:Methyltransferase type 11 [Candidatus Brocadiaceae bacterium]